MLKKRNPVLSFFRSGNRYLYSITKRKWLELFAAAFAVGLLLSGAFFIWAATLQIPDISTFDTENSVQSTKIYDRTGEVELYDIHENIRRTAVTFEEISPYIKNATVAVEDADFYTHGGIKPSSIVRAILANIMIKLHLQKGYTQGGSTITQQVIKNSVLTQEKTFSRKVKEWVLAIKLDRALDKNSILNLYLNVTPYGGNIYGIEQASRTFFGKSAKDVTLVEAAYLAAIPQAPTYYSPYGSHKDALEGRKALVLRKMKENGLITEAEYDAANKEKATFKAQEPYGIQAPHFVQFIKDYLVEKYGERVVEEGGLKVTTSLDFALQIKAEEIVKAAALANEKTFHAENAGMIAIDPTNGQILVMVGSRNYFDKDIDGNYNVTLAHRQPGSSFKPFIYATAFNKGYTPDTVLFDVKTEFSTGCSEDSKKLAADAVCYSPQNYDNNYHGPIKLRDALAQSLNIPAVKLFYLAGRQDSLETAQALGITTLGDINRYGLTLVLGGGEVTLLDMTSAYSVFANNGVRNPYASILKVEDASGKVLEEFIPSPQRVLAEQSALKITEILSDDVARTPEFGAHSALYFPGRQVAVKTGTTNDYRDAWILGYTPHIVVGSWAGNNDNSPMQKKIAGFIVAPMWNKFMTEVLKTVPNETYPKPEPEDQNLKPVLRGIWQGGESYFVDKASGAQATEFTPAEMKEERVVPAVHSILYWLNKNDPTGPKPDTPENDPQFIHWEYAVRKWADEQGLKDGTSGSIPQQTDTVHTPDAAPKVNIVVPQANQTFNMGDKVTITVQENSSYPIADVQFFINDQYIGSNKQVPYSFSFVPSDVSRIQTGSNVLKVVMYDNVQNQGQATVSFMITE